ncbi:TlpA disulfide reductase family protein [Pseudomonas ovata]|uniref:TlpA disulfide reductase family protein n=1 Tax=Pseudomonas ovata TaxID=1839709 RepID=UPI000D69DD0C|nr:TlpA disulfide reductase family protein [Pseudomonas ovata]
MLTLNLGPFALGMHHALVLASLMAATLTGGWLGRRQGCNPERQLFWLLIIALLVARLVFVARYFEHYQGALWRIIDIRDGGFSAWPGVGVALAVGGWLTWRTQPLRKPLGAALAVGVLGWGAANLVWQGLERDSALPAVTLHDQYGQPVDWQATAGKPRVVNLWATWCPPCRREMPVLMDAQADHPDIEFVFVNQGETPDTVTRFLRSQNLALRNVLFDADSQFGRTVGSTALPTTLFYDAQGRRVASHLGELSSASLAQTLEAFKP